MEPPVGEAPRASLADFAPFRVRPFAQLLTNSLDGLSLGGRILLTTLMVLFGIHEMVQSRQEWYQGNAAIEQAKLARIQQQREQAEVTRNIEQAMTAVAQREADVSNTLKPLQEGWEYAQYRAAVPNMARYQERYLKAKEDLKACETPGRCNDVDKARLRGEMDVYRMLFFSAKAQYDRIQSMVKTPPESWKDFVLEPEK